MTAPITIPIEQSRRYLARDTLRLEIDGEAQPDRVNLWGSERGRIGYGRGRYGRGRYGRGRSLGYGIGAYGRGVYGQGARILQHQTSNSFPSGDYSVRARAVDPLGNVGDYGDAATVSPRNQPAKPSNLRITASTLTWSYSA